MNLKQFKYVSVLAETRSFSKAAEILNVSQPSLSQYIKYLEKEIGIELFDRTGSDVKLTDAGAAYIEAGEKILHLEHQLQNKFADLKNSKAGTLTIGTSLYRGTCIMPKVLSDFSSEFPGIKVIVKEQLEKEMLDEADHGLLDLFITALPVNEKKFDYQFMFSEELLLAAPKTLKLKTDPEGKADIRDLLPLRFISLEDNQLIQTQWDRVLDAHQVSVAKAIECRNIITQIAMVSAGIGVAIVPSTTQIMGAMSRDVAFYRIKQQLPRRDVVVAHTKNRYLSQASQYMISLLTGLGGNEI